MANFCPNCGQQQADSTSNFCPNCGQQLNNRNPEPAQAPPGTTFDEEVVILNGLCNRVKNPLYVQNGKAMLTNKRFIYLKHSFAKIMAIGVFVNLTAGEIDFDIPLDNIESLSDARQGVSKTIKIHTKTGETFHFYFTKREEWKIALQNQVNKRKT